MRMISGPSENAHDPKKPLFLTLHLKNYFKTYKKTATFFQQILWLEITKYQTSNILENTRAENP